MSVKFAKHRFNQWIVMGLIAGIVNVASAQILEENKMNKEQTKVLNTIESMTESFNNKDINGVLDSYETDAAVMFEPNQAITDIEIIKQMFEGAFQINPNFNYPKGHEVYITNDIALHIAPWIMNGNTPDGEKITKSGLSIAVLRKQKNGEWLMVLDNPNGQSLLD